MKKILFLTTLITLAACGPRQENNSQEPLVYSNSSVLAYVDNQPITQADFDKAANNLDDNFKKFVTTKSGRANFLSFLISEKLLLLDAKNRDIDSTPEYQAEIKALEEAQKNALETAKNFALRRNLLENLAQDGILGVSESEIKEYYKKYPYEITIKQFIISDSQKAAEVMKQMRNVRSTSKFAEFARQFSDEPLSKKSGGDMPPFIPGEYLPQIEVPAANSRLMEVQGFITTAQGNHIFMKVSEKRLTYDEAKNRIKMIIENQKLDSYLNSLNKKYNISIVKEETK
ncbi:MAG: peptidylprolyl isomerase [Elusimicrobiaceae bacterium]|nr:peptidylprolyl isomerase [Elusimicrobiaceae bacterium]